MADSKYNVTAEGDNVAWCDCCGNASKTVWGWVNTGPILIGAYFVHWTVDRPDHGANFDLILGQWGDETSSADRVIVSTIYRVIGDNSGFMVVDAENSPDKSALAERALRRDEVVGTDLATETFAVLDAIWFQDQRIEEVHRF